MTTLFLVLYILGIFLFYITIKYAVKTYKVENEDNQEKIKITIAAMSLFYPIVMLIAIIGFIIKNVFDLYKLWKR